ncbi:MAG: BMP family ABC transporter substrate-binding protein, partial [Chloroflexi bacterium]|nr:BMP family ABC transporter substrate-binding protein [Chloroflexota bacterium]
DIWAGPILDQEGNIRIPEGEAMSSEDKLTMDYLVEGVEGEIPE